jgi:hypothetical protein
MKATANSSFHIDTVVIMNSQRYVLLEVLNEVVLASVSCKRKKRPLALLIVEKDGSARICLYLTRRLPCSPEISIVH